jgi:hypothetical protein
VRAAATALLRAEVFLAVHDGAHHSAGSDPAVLVEHGQRLELCVVFAGGLFPRLDDGGPIAAGRRMQEEREKVDSLFRHGRGRRRHHQ